MNTTSVMLTVLVLNLHHRHNDKPVPRWLKTIVLHGLARILCMYSREQRQEDIKLRQVLNIVHFTNSAIIRSFLHWVIKVDFNSHVLFCPKMISDIPISLLFQRYGRSEVDKNKGREKKDKVHHRNSSGHSGKDGYSLAFAASQLSTNMRNSSALFPPSG